MRRRKAKQLLLFTLGLAPKKKKKPRRKRAEVTIARLLRDDVDFDRLDERDQRYVQSIIEQRKRQVQSRWSADEELHRRLPLSSGDPRRFVQTDDGRLVERLLIAPTSLGDSDDSADD